MASCENYPRVALKDFPKQFVTPSYLKSQDLFEIIINGHLNNESGQPVGLRLIEIRGKREESIRVPRQQSKDILKPRQAYTIGQMKFPNFLNTKKNLKTFEWLTQSRPVQRKLILTPLTSLGLDFKVKLTVQDQKSNLT